MKPLSKSITFQFRTDLSAKLHFTLPQRNFSAALGMTI